MKMGIFCSYYMENNISRLRNSILNTQINEMKQLLAHSEGSLLVSKAIKAKVDSEIDNLGNTPLLFSIEHRKVESFRFILSEFQPNVEQGNHYTNLKPLHCLALSKLKSEVEVKHQAVGPKLSTVTELSFVGINTNDSDGMKVSGDRGETDLILGYHLNTIENHELLEMIHLLLGKGKCVRMKYESNFKEL